MRGISWLAANQLASQEGLCTMELVSIELDHFRYLQTQTPVYYVYIFVILHTLLDWFCGPGSSVGTATELRAERSADRIPVGARFSAPDQTGLGAHPAFCTMGTGSFPGVKYGWGVTLTTHPLLVPRSWNSRAIPLPTLWATPGLYRGYFTFTFIGLILYPIASCKPRWIDRIWNTE
jgi:hypothetical protein